MQQFSWRRRAIESTQLGAQIIRRWGQAVAPLSALSLCVSPAVHNRALTAAVNSTNHLFQSRWSRVAAWRTDEGPGLQWLSPGLTKEFNSLEAQREAALAYIASQRHDGWVAKSERYDDGGYTGANMERPALQRLLTDVAAGRIDVVLV